MNKKEFYLINEKIKAKNVRITGENIESKIIDLEDALKLSYSMNMDLVLINNNVEPPICKITDYKKFIYEKRLKEKLKNKKQKNNKLKEIRFTYNTGEHDINFKLNHAISFLEKGDKVKATIIFSGREITFKEQGELLLLNFYNKLKDYGKLENLPKLENKKLWVIINPK